jgi:glycosyltransferase involved in cell wall biosynthesis
VCTDNPATSEVLNDGETALLVRPGDPAAMSAAIRRLRADPALRDRLGDAAHQAVEHYSWQARARRILNAMGAPRKDS